jgi:anti-sigma factor RsiW
MSCEPFRGRLSELLYGGLRPGERAEVERHLADCSTCRRERAALEALAHALDAVPPAEGGVDLPRLYRDAAERRARQARRWRLAAAGVGVAAVVLLALFALRLEVRLEGHQMVVRWGVPPEPVAPAPPPVVIREVPAVSAEDMQLIKELVHALAADVEASERRNLASVVRLQQRLEDMQRQTQRRWADTERDVSALYTAQFGPRRKGDEP